MANKEWIKKGADGLSFGERLGDLISNSKTTATALAKDTGLSQSAISDYLNKDRAPDCATVYALARHFSVSADYLLGIDPIPATNLTVRDIHRKTGLSEENVNRLMELESYSSGLSYSDFVNMCLDAAYYGRGNFIFLARAKASKMQYEQMKADSSSSISLSETYSEMVKAMEEAEKQAQELGCNLLSYDESIKFYAREIAHDLERYLLGVFNNGND